MIPKREWDAYNRSVDRICSQADSSAVRAVLAAVRAGELSGMGIAEVREQVKAVLEPVAIAYAEAASELAAEWYDMEADGHGYKLPAAVTQVDPCGDAVDATVRYQIRKLMDGDAEGFARACGALARDAAVRQLNSTIMANAARDRGRGVRFARVTTGRETCAFCYMLASRGAVYHTRETAGQFDHYHRRCDCKVVPGFEDDPDAVLVEGHDPALMRSRMALIEEQTGLSFSERGDLSRISSDMELRDKGWLYHGAAPAVSYADEETRKLKAHDPDHGAERRTAERLAANGYEAVFITDEIAAYDAKKGMSQVIGLCDLKSGIEIKNVSRARSENTISKHLAKSKRKGGCKIVAIDISENGDLSDEVAEAMMVRSLQRHDIDSAILIAHDGKAKVLRK